MVGQRPLRVLVRPHVLRNPIGLWLRVNARPTKPGPSRDRQRTVSRLEVGRDAHHDLLLTGDAARYVPDRRESDARWRRSQERTL